MRPVVRTLDVGDLSFRIHSSQHVSAVAPTYVLLHGIGMSHRSMARLHDVLARSGSTHSVDMPGFGGLPKPKKSADVAAMAHGLAAVLDRRGIDGAVVIGHSMGAQWAVELAAQRPDLASAVVAISPCVDDEARSLSAQAVALGLDSLGEPPNVNAIVLTDYVRCGLPFYLQQLRHMLEYPIEKRVVDLAAPLLVVRGGRDPIAGLDWARRLRARARDGLVVVIPQHQHVAQYTAPKSVAAAITAFVASHAASHAASHTTTSQASPHAASPAYSHAEPAGVNADQHAGPAGVRS